MVNNMKKIKFLKGFRGVLTQEQHWKRLDVVELDDNTADALVDRGVAEYHIDTTPKKSTNMNLFRRKVQ